jgi:hypothetical protein
MYNTNFQVKYHDICIELLAKIQNCSEPQDYSESEIHEVCSKLYRDELTSVFYAKDITDDKIDHGIKTISGKLITNPDFSNIINELKIQFQNYFSNIIDDNIYDSKNIEFIIFLTLFSDKIFYIMHKCICQHLLVEKIDNALLLELKNVVIGTLSD